MQRKKPLGFDTIKETFSEPLQRSALGGTHLLRKEAKVNKQEGPFAACKSQEHGGKPSTSCLPPRAEGMALPAASARLS